MPGTSGIHNLLNGMAASPAAPAACTAHWGQFPVPAPPQPAGQPRQMCGSLAPAQHPGKHQAEFELGLNASSSGELLQGNSSLPGQEWCPACCRAAHPRQRQPPPQLQHAQDRCHLGRPAQDGCHQIAAPNIPQLRGPPAHHRRAAHPAWAPACRRRHPHTPPAPAGARRAVCRGCGAARRGSAPQPFAPNVPTVPGLQGGQEAAMEGQGRCTTQRACVHSSRGTRRRQLAARPHRCRCRRAWRRRPWPAAGSQSPGQSGSSR